jgi:hypothetical protein
VSATITPLITGTRVARATALQRLDETLAPISW